MYAITYDVRHSLLKVALTGMWDTATVERYNSERMATLRRLGWEAGQYVCLVDVREQPVLSREVTDRGRDIFEDGRSAPAKTALLTHSALKRLQLARAIESGGAQIFDDEREALKWLLEAA